MESEWKRQREPSDVSAKWYHIGLMPEDEDSDQDDNGEDNQEDDDDNDSYGFEGSNGSEEESGDSDRFRRFGKYFELKSKQKIRWYLSS